MEHRMDVVVTGYYYCTPSLYSDTKEISPEMAANMDEANLNDNSVLLEELVSELTYKIVHSEECECQQST